MTKAQWELTWEIAHRQLRYYKTNWQKNRERMTPQDVWVQLAHAFLLHEWQEEEEVMKDYEV